MKRILSCLMPILLIAACVHAEPEERNLVRVKDYKWLQTSVVKRLDLPRGYHEGLYYDGKDMWVSNGKKGSTWVVDLETGKVKSHIKPVGPFTESIAYGGDGTYYVSDWDDMKLYRAELKGDKLIALKSMSFEPSRPAGALLVGDKIYVVTWTRGMGTKFHLLELDRDGHLLAIINIKCIQEPSQLAYDGEYLWITSWYSKLVYKVDMSSWKAVAVFTSPVADATGIAWVNGHLWITGTHGDLYQLKVG